MYDGEHDRWAPLSAYRAAAPNALVVYGVKAFPNAAVLRLLAAEGLGADVSTLGELELALLAGLPGERLVVHGNNKSDEELRGSRRGRRALRGRRCPRRGRARRRGRSSAHPRAGHAGGRGRHASFDPDGARGVEVRPAAGGRPGGARRAREAGLETAGVHVHIGSQLMDTRAGLPRWNGSPASRFAAATSSGGRPGVVDLGGGLGIQYVRGQAPQSIEDFVGSCWGESRSRLGRAGPACRRGSSSSRAGRSSAAPG